MIDTWTRDETGKYTHSASKYAGIEIRKFGRAEWHLVVNGMSESVRKTLREAKLLAAYKANEQMVNNEYLAITNAPPKVQYRMLLSPFYTEG
jgi:hypothetical protein